MMSAAAVTGKVVLFLSVMGLGALVMYFGAIGMANASRTSECGDNSHSAVTISITKYNLITNVNCSGS